MLELSLVNCIISPGRGLACMLGKCKNLEKIHLDMCVGMCPIRELALDHVYSFNDVGMEALCSAHYLETLELVRCQEIRQFPRLCILRLKKCLGVTDDGLYPLSGTDKLDFLAVEDCPQISERGVQGAARSVSFRQDLSWITGQLRIPKLTKCVIKTPMCLFTAIMQGICLDLHFQKRVVSQNFSSSAVLKDQDRISVCEDIVHTRL
ncbi:hypothetical protein NC652_037805 [Populus alba x Populus x berolinensis]|nr:hypothetical protein NC652_037805 [Populus alba x Populus x berolinensis]